MAFGLSPAVSSAIAIVQAACILGVCVLWWRDHRALKAEILAVMKFALRREREFRETTETPPRACEDES